jgi:hypothetical protein
LTTGTLACWINAKQKQKKQSNNSFKRKISVMASISTKSYDPNATKFYDPDATLSTIDTKPDDFDCFENKVDDSNCLEYKAVGFNCLGLYVDASMGFVNEIKITKEGPVEYSVSHESSHNMDIKCTQIKIQEMIATHFDTKKEGPHKSPYLLGQRVTKLFKAGMFTGVITSMWIDNIKNPKLYYHVEYDDDDNEDYTLSAVKKILEKT